MPSWIVKVPVPITVEALATGADAALCACASDEIVIAYEPAGGVPVTTALTPVPVTVACSAENAEPTVIAVVAV